MVYYLFGLKSGICYYYSANNIIKFSAHYRLGRLNGEAKQFYNNGNIFFNLNYKNNVLHGEFKKYSMSNILLSQGNYTYGRLDGDLKLYNNQIVSKTYNIMNQKIIGFKTKYYKIGSLEDKKTRIVQKFYNKNTYNQMKLKSPKKTKSKKNSYKIDETLFQKMCY